MAFIHRSYINEHEEVRDHNERLEFIGDAVLGLLVTEYLYHHYLQEREGRLSYLRSCLVDASACARYIESLRLEEFLLVGRGETLFGNKRQRSSLHADLFEALIAAIYLDGGIAAASRFFFGKCLAEVERTLSNPEANWKALLQDYCQRQHHNMPAYRLLKESGPDHQKTFVVEVAVHDEPLAEGKGSSKKEAQQEAAKNGVLKLVEMGCINLDFASF